jgi:hypothetical protein
MEKLENRVLLHYYWKQNLKQQKRRTKYAKWKAKMSSQIAQRRTCSRDSMTGTPVSNMNHALVAQSLWILKPCVKRSEPIRQPALADCPLNSTFHGRQLLGIFHQLGKVKKHCREAPHELTPAQAQRRVDTCRQLLQNPHDERFIRRNVTCDEKWVYFKSRQTKSMF